MASGFSAHARSVVDRPAPRASAQLAAQPSRPVRALVAREACRSNAPVRDRARLCRRRRAPARRRELRAARSLRRSRSAPRRRRRTFRRRNERARAGRGVEILPARALPSHYVLYASVMCPFCRFGRARVAGFSDGTFSRNVFDRFDSGTRLAARDGTPSLYRFFSTSAPAARCRARARRARP